MSDLRKGMAAVVAALLVTAVPSAYASPSAPPDPSRPQPDGRLLARPAHGDAAIERLGDDIGQAARLNSMSVPEMERLLLHDRTAWVHPTGRIYFVDRAPEQISAEAPERAPFPYEQTFQLHSRPGSSRTIYLDFDGQTVSGTAWNGDTYLLPAQTHPAFSLDGDASTFSNAERDLIQSVWQRVSEDYAPFDVDVTTADPGTSGLVKDFAGDPTFGTRALITPSESASDTLCGGQCGGVAFIATYGLGSAYYQPAWVFPQSLGNDTKAIAEAVTHEVGHNVGLSHDGLPGVSYYEGHGSWAPIMGSGYDRPITQWSKGEYAGATNTQDDLSIITQNGLSPMPDDHGDDIAGATTVTSQDRTATGLVSAASDQDVFAFPQGCDGPVTFTVTPASTSPDLDVRLRILGADGTQLAVNDPASGTSTYDLATGLGAAATVPVTAGTTVYAEVDGVGAGNPATDGYSDYASLGRFTISSTGCTPGLVSFQNATGSAPESAGAVQLTVVRTGSTSAPASVHYAVTGGTATQGADFDLAAGTATFAAGASQASIPVSITDDSVTEPDETVQVTLSAPSGGLALGTPTVSTLTITDDDDVVAGAQPDLLIGLRPDSGYLGDDIYNNDGTGQTITQKARRGQLRSFYVLVTNDGTSTSTFTVWGTKTARVTYWNNGNDLTPAMTSVAGATAQLAPDDYAVIRVDVRIARKAAIGSRKAMQVTAVSDSGEVLTDVVAGSVKVIRG